MNTFSGPVGDHSTPGVENLHLSQVGQKWLRTGAVFKKRACLLLAALWGDHSAPGVENSHLSRVGQKWLRTGAAFKKRECLLLAVLWVTTVPLGWKIHI